MQCPHCEASWPDELAGILKYCGSCGRLIDEAGSPVEGHASPPDGELRYITVVFADLAGFTAFAEDRPPDQVAEIVGDLLQHLGQIVEEHNGSVDKFLGDALVATFGVPRGDSNAARNAVRAGLAMQEQMANFNRESGLTFGLRVGIHGGEAMFRAVGNSWTVMGDTVNTASRIQSVTTPGRVWLSQTVYEEVRRYFNLIPRPAVELKGKKQSIQPYEVVSEHDIPLVNLPPFVGREEEWAYIQELLKETVGAKRLNLLVIRGAAGIGKSRIVWELREWAQRTAEIYRLDVIQYDHSTRLPSHGLNALIRGRFFLPMELEEDAILNQLAENLPAEYLTLQPGHEALATEFFAFALGIQHPGFRSQSMDGASTWNNTFLEIKSWLESQARQTPWILLIEDIQKGDADTAAFFDWALKIEWHAPVFVMLTLREEDFGAEGYWYAPLEHWKEQGLVHELQLRELDPKTLATALAQLGEGRISNTLARRIAEHTEGNPLFATELALFIKDSETQVHDIENMPLPGSIREVMEARLERLGLNGKEVAKRGALMGRRFTIEAVERIWDRAPHEMDSGVRVLHQTETIYSEASKLFAGEMEEVFRHGRLQEVALARIPGVERQRWLGELESWAQSKLDRLGDYWEGAAILLLPLIARSRIEQDDRLNAGLWYEILGWLHKKNHRALEAEAAFQQAWPCVDGTRRLALCRLIADLQIYNGRVRKARETLEAGLAEAIPSTKPDSSLPARLKLLVDDPLARWDTLSPAEIRLAARLTYGEALARMGEIGAAENTYREIQQELKQLRGIPADILRLRWANQWGYLQSELVGNPHEAEEAYAQLRSEIDLNARALQSEKIAFISTQFNIEMRMGRYDRAKTSADELLALARACSDPRQEARAWNSLGITATGLGDWNNAADDYDQCLQLARSIGDRRMEAISLHNLGLIRMDLAEYDAAAQCQLEYHTISQATGNKMADAYAPAYLGACALSQGDFERAVEYLDKSKAAAEQNDWPRLVGLNFGLRGQLYFRKWLEQRDRADLLARAIKEFETGEESWKGTDEAGEFYAILALAQHFDGQPAAAQATIERASDNVDQSWTVARIFLELAETFCKGESIRPQLDWFRERGFKRGAQFAQKLEEVAEL